MHVGYVVLTYMFEKEGRRWTAYCEELGTATFGRSLPEAQRKLVDAVGLHLNTLEQVGERRRFFREHGIKFHRAKPAISTIRIPIREATFVQSHIQRVPNEQTPQLAPAC